VADSVPPPNSTTSARTRGRANARCIASARMH